MCDFSETLERLYTKTEAVKIFIKQQFFIVKKIYWKFWKLYWKLHWNYVKNENQKVSSF